MPKRLVQVAGFTVKHCQLHGWTVRVGAQRERDDSGATASVVTALQLAEQIQRTTSRSRVRERLRHVSIEITLLQVGPREELACKQVLRIELERTGGPRDHVVVATLVPVRERDLQMHGRRRRIAFEHT